MAVTLAVTSVAAAMTRSRVRPASTPSERASSSPSDRTLTCQRSSTSGTSPSATAGSAGAMSAAVTEASEPSSQNVIAGSWS